MAFLVLKMAKNFPAAQPWWAAGCAVTGVGGQGKKCYTPKWGPEGFGGVRRGVWGKSNLGQLDKRLGGGVKVLIADRPQAQRNNEHPTYVHRGDTL